MNTTAQKNISEQVSQWIAFDELPTHPGLKPIREFDGLYPEDEDERTAYFDFLHWYLTYDNQTLFSIPTNTRDGFNKLQIDEQGDDISAFNTIDYNNKHPFNIHSWIVKKACEQAKDLGITYSVLQNPDARLRALQRFVNFATTQPLKNQNLLWTVWREHAYSP